MRLRDLLEAVGYTCLQGDIDTEIHGISQDNRKVEPGNLFICIAGSRFDTHELTMEIAARGAAAFVAERPVEAPSGTAVVLVESCRAAMARIYAAFYGYPARGMKLVGITGTKGKTTTAQMIVSVLKAGGLKVGSIGTNGTDYDGKHIENGNTTPDSYEIQRHLRGMADAGCQAVVLEVSSQAEKMHRVDGLEFDYSIFTNISPGDHVSPTEHKDFAEYMECKSMLFDHSKVAFVNRDDENWEKIVEGRSCRAFTYGCSPEADYRAEILEKAQVHGLPGLRLVTSGQDSGEYLVNMPGLFNGYNALAAVCIGRAFGISQEKMQEALCRLYIPARLEMVYVSDKLSVCVDSAHSGYSMQHLIEALREYHPKRVIVIFGCGGNRSRDRRFDMGEVCGNLADFSIVTTEHNRFETFESIVRDIREGLGRTKGSYMVIEDRAAAIRYAIERAQDGDMIAVTGLGHDKHQAISGKNVPFDDVAFARATLKEFGYLQ
ncbi:UDP-N-acetylmuramoyl-L-alanyl-D-glutamate--2,6-diaminopimelate ligase [Cuneatibacter caecimuris]|uniref:UDP-N-acetylmuramyl-tripeptide synthetase n=1 Tax=Cuneatibacter caecimuris TaxID=1796618 RepID=A0A4Q7PNI4_9FIRM|nr:UDP-N-acetylmuramoyl-L-alanyl-D-glutamate--2,6-diaminopimelate ligase [Cuneatibacter caecimuris]RZT02444.1 UDP-N-acetylmuramoylalanyl-D-glutamate--2,6-diaminopimelate ligase [Cuneatibacter caecimuris]